MMRWLRRILICLIVGAITTVAVSVGLTLLVNTWRMPHDNVIYTVDEHEFRNAVHFRGLGSQRVLIEVIWPSSIVIADLHPRRGEDRRNIRLRDPHDLERLTAAAAQSPRVQRLPLATIPDDWARAAMDDDAPMVFESRGWPCLSAWGTYEMSVDDGVRSLQGVIDLTSLAPTQDRMFRARVVPLIPRLPGFAVNTGYYAALWCAVFIGYCAMRRSFRRRRGRCPQCGYDLRGGFASGCPECGWNRGEARE